ncbi:MAG: transcriptional regulator [Capsulimonas sp.]|jgi:TetR/AcrR family transcriptional repressor of nem operon|nr:transcriptional regulator [Capsulimonas sp.]
MPKPSHREKLLSEGLRVLHERGFSGASVRDITLAAGAPLGSFTNHFVSKEAFSLEALNLYFGRYQQVIGETLRNDALPPLARLRAYIETVTSSGSIDDISSWNGCLIGNFSAEASEHSELIRLRLAQILDELEAGVSYCLQAAVAASELPGSTDCDEVAGFVVSSIQGAILLSKAKHSAVPIERFKRVLFSVIL